MEPLTVNSVKLNDSSQAPSDQQVTVNSVKLNDSSEAPSDQQIQFKYLTNRTKQTLFNLIENSSADGLSHAVSSSTQRARVFWLLVVVGGAFGFIVNTSMILSRYIKCPINTETKYLESFLFQWPDITICNPTNPIPFSIDETLKQKWREYLTLSNETLQRPQSISTTPLLGAMASMNPLALKMNSPHPFIVSGEVHAQVFDARLITRRRIMALNAEEFFFTRWMEDGFSGELPPTVCYTLNMSRVKERFENQHPRGPYEMKSVQFLIDLNVHDYLQFNSMLLRKAAVFITRPNSSLVSQNPQPIVGGEDVSFFLSLIHYNRVKRNSKCRSEDFLFEEFDAGYSNSIKYRGGVKDCQFFKLQEMFFQKCKCYWHSLPMFKLSLTSEPPRLCYNMTLFNGSELTANARCLEETIYANLSADVYKDCEKYRHPPCNQTTYKVNHFKSSIPNELTDAMKLAFRSIFKASSNAHLTSHNLSHLLKNIAIVTFENDQEFIKSIEEYYEYSVSELLSDIGGLLGLWMGLSVVSVFEILEMIYIGAIVIASKLSRLSR